jgi:protein O-GlcNAc transferase
MTPQTQALIGQAVQLLQSGQPERAESILKKILEVQKNNLPALEIMGLIKGSQGKHAECAEYLKKAVKINPNNPATQYNLAKALTDSGEYEKAIHHHQKAVALAPNNQSAWINYGTTLSLLNNNSEALDKFDRALSLSPFSEEALLNKFLILKKMGRYDDALVIASGLLEKDPNNSIYLWRFSEILSKQSRELEALSYIEKATEINPKFYDARLLRGEIEYKLKLLDKAEASSKKLIELNPNSSEAWCNTGAVLNEQKKYREAVLHTRKAIELNHNYPEAWANLALSQIELKDYKNSIKSYKKAFELRSDIKFLLGSKIYSQQLIADWDEFDKDKNLLKKRIDSNIDLCTPFVSLSLYDDPGTQLKISQEWSNLIRPPIENQISPFFYPSNKKLKIGYFSADYKNHPVSMLLVELFELHDRERFEIHAFSLENDPENGPLRLRLEESFDYFHNVGGLSDLEISNLSRKLNIDISVDLGGYTLNARPNIFYYRTSPIQISYFGYAATSGSKNIDYLIADQIVIPHENQKFFSEKILYLPKCFLIDDSKRISSERTFTRQELGIPLSSFVFSCFNNSYKFNPEVIEIWIEILNSVPNSVLWLSANNPDFMSNILKIFKRNFIDEGRIVFAYQLKDITDHLSRIKNADLFLDTFPYNAHTTALDSLKSCVPVLTLQGNSFAGRVASSLLNNLGLSELIAHNRNEYVSKAIELALNHDLLKSIKLKLITNLSKSNLFNTKLHCEYLEKIYSDIYSDIKK